jgi:hypothetical protein
MRKEIVFWYSAFCHSIKKVCTQGVEALMKLTFCCFPKDVHKWSHRVLLFVCLCDWKCRAVKTPVTTSRVQFGAAASKKFLSYPCKSQLNVKSKQCRGVTMTCFWPWVIFEKVSGTSKSPFWKPVSYLKMWKDMHHTRHCSVCTVPIAQAWYLWLPSSNDG